PRRTAPSANTRGTIGRTSHPSRWVAPYASSSMTTAHRCSASGIGRSWSGRGCACGGGACRPPAGTANSEDATAPERFARGLSWPGSVVLRAPRSARGRPARRRAPSRARLEHHNQARERRRRFAVPELEPPPDEHGLVLQRDVVEPPRVGAGRDQHHDRSASTARVVRLLHPLPEPAAVRRVAPHPLGAPILFQSVLLLREKLRALRIAGRRRGI